MSGLWHPAAFAAICLLAGMLPVSAVAQRTPGPELSILAGPSPYHLSKSGTGVAISAGLAFRPTQRVLVVEPGLGFFFFRNDFGQGSHWFFPEVSVQAEAGLGSIRPFVGGGGGIGIEARIGSDRVVGTLHAVAGVRLRLATGWGARAEVRWRGVPPGSGHTADFCFGFVRGIG
ncbi:MAG TPA: hypothetical protein VGQ24_13015 [Gemmatimonadales bacterium]|nr:hypothetical protein [Gemmatimonadales bacterium]